MRETWAGLAAMAWAIQPEFQVKDGAAGGAAGGATGGAAGGLPDGLQITFG